MESKQTIKEIPIEQVYGNPNQPRKYFNEEALKELALSIQEHGLISPIRVKPDGKGKYIIICGERRYRAMKILEWAFVTAQIANLEQQKADEQAIIENLQREDITVMEEAKSYQYMLEKYGIGIPELAKKLGLKPAKHAWITMRMSLLKLKPEYQQLIDKEGGITSQMGIHLSRLSEEGQRKVMKKTDLNTPKKFINYCLAIQAKENENDMFEVKELTEAEKATLSRIETRIEKGIQNFNILDDKGLIKEISKIEPNKAREYSAKLKALAKQMGVVARQLDKKAVLDDR